MSNEDFARELEALRANAGFSLRRLERASGIPRSTLSDALSGRRFPQLDTVLAIVRACEADPQPWRRRWAQLSRGRRTGTDRARATATPRQVPAGVRHFVGRTDEVKLLSNLLGDQATGGALAITQIGGAAGIGKTALALHWAHRNADRFPDGQLYVDLRGFDPSGMPLAPAEVIRRFLAALEVPPEQIPVDPDELTALYRSRLADRRMLVLLDNARDADQVRPILPGSPGCLVLITSRNELRSLVARDGAVPLTLDLLTVSEARELLTRRLGHERLGTDENLVDELIRRCGRLPLALNIAAARAALRPTHSLSSLVDELRDTRACLDALSRADGAADLRAVFFWSYRTLGAEAARVFRLLGLHPGPDLSEAAAASLTALDLESTRRALDELTAAGLIQEHTAGRYTLHDLLRAYAADRARADDSPDEQRDALRRMCDFYAHTARAAAHRLVPQRPHPQIDGPMPGTVVHHLPDTAAAMAWLDAEHPNLLATQQVAAARRWPAMVWQLAWDLVDFHNRRGYRPAQLVVSQAALRAAARLADFHRVRAHWMIGVAYAELARHDEAIEQLSQALTLADRQADPADRAHAHRRLAWAWGKRGDDRRGMDHATRALALFHELDQPLWEASLLNATGWFAAHLGEYDAARTACQAASRLYREHHEPEGEADTLDSLGYIEYRTGHHEQAIAYYQEALARYRGIAHAYQVARVLDHIGHPYASLGQHRQARTMWRHARDLYRQQGRDQAAERVQHQLDTQPARPPLP